MMATITYQLTLASDDKLVVVVTVDDPPAARTGRRLTRLLATESA
jgi:hypothetical protein